MSLARARGPAKVCAGPRALVVRCGPAGERTGRRWIGKVRKDQYGLSSLQGICP
ncbi:MAG: hypothetical protein QG608_1908 [Actinomycetota bacterium]|nr:hypothetical protein [Actinomycetota bacterium]